MTSKQSKHQAATGSQPKDGIRKPARLTILAIIYALCIAAAIAFHAREGVQQLMEDPARICIWSLCFLLCLIYHKKRSSYRVAAEHTVLPPLTVILLVTGYFPDVAMFLIIVTIITSIITARSLKNRHSSRRNHACANPTDQNIICEYFSRTVNYHQPEFRQCCD